MIFLVDFGSQTAHLIARRVRSFGVEVKIVAPKDAYAKAKKEKPAGLIFSGGPASVYERGAPTVNKKIYSLGMPILGICYGQQLTGYLIGGKVELGKIREYGPAAVELKGRTALLKGVPRAFEVWMSHGDKVVRPPRGFWVTGKTGDVAIAAMSDDKRKIYCIQFHPEVSHTEHGSLILENFVKLCGLKVTSHGVEIKDLVEQLKQQMPEGRAICAVSGGIDSTVSAMLAAKAIGKRLVPIYVESGLMRLGTKEQVKQLFAKHVGVKVDVVEAKKEFLAALKGIEDPEKKRKAIGKLYIRLFEQEAKKFSDSKYLIQGTIYSDVIESQGTRHADKIKSHHNVGGLPKNIGLKIVEPVREFYKDEVRLIAKKLRLPGAVVWQHVFPGPGLGIRIRGEVTYGRLKMLQRAETILQTELNKVMEPRETWMTFAIYVPIKTTGVKGDARSFGDVIAIRSITSFDAMTADWTRLPYELLAKVSSRIVNEIRGISRVVYDITTKPPATMEWE